MNAPKISVIIPMYNVEKYVGDCFESLLAQTFQDFEVIVVDDCSTDSSCEIVKSYAPRFGGRLKLLKTETNSGGCAIPRNRGLPFSRGEYVFFMDADDLLTLTALEELYTLAKKFDADVVHCGRNYEATNNLSEIHISKSKFNYFAEVPTLETDDFTIRIHNVLNWRYKVTIWSKMIKGSLLVDNELVFPPCRPAEDDILTYGLIFFAKRFLHVPNVVYIRRQSDNSILRKEKSPQQTINFWLSPIVDGIKFLDNMLDKLEFFRRNPKYRYAVLEHFTHNQLRSLFEASLELSADEICAAIKDEFGNRFGDYDVLFSWLVTDLIMQQKFFAANQRRISELEKNK